jgi:NADH-quinone oxidoreductase subunit L
VGVPEAIVAGGNRIEHFLAPSFLAPGTIQAAAGAQEHHVGLELSLMAVSTVVALAGIALATVLFARRPVQADAAPAGLLHRLLANKYYVDEIYDAVIVQPIKHGSSLLWRGIDAGLIDGTVNGAGLVVRGWSSVLRRVQTGSVRAYAMSFFGGVVVIVGYYLWR